MRRSKQNGLRATMKMAEWVVLAYRDGDLWTKKGNPKLLLEGDNDDGLRVIKSTHAVLWHRQPTHCMS